MSFRPCGWSNSGKRKHASIGLPAEIVSSNPRGAMIQAVMELAVFLFPFTPITQGY